ncbi:MAG: molybdenum ABC transporter ATP-binding protein [Ramlibacter sp.]
MGGIQLQLDMRRGDFALAVDLDLPGRGITALFGPSGSGKTTCLRAIAGLEAAGVRHVAVDGEVWHDAARGVCVPTHRRALGYVFQEASLFPHLSVRGNLEFGQRRTAGNERRFALDDITGLLGIGELLERAPATLSGGERQRVAIARALLASPRLLLMDEPLASLDSRRKQEILPYLERLHDELAIPIIYVSHAPDEVARLADHLVLLEGGRVAASGPLTETLARLDLPSTFADDAGVVVHAVLEGHEDDGLSRLSFAGGVLYVGHRPEPIGSRLRCRIQARDVSLSLARPTGSSILNLLPATVTAMAPANAQGQVTVRLQLGGVPLLARITERSRRELAIAEGSQVWVQIKAVALLG